MQYDMASVSCHCNLSCVRALVWGWALTYESDGVRLPTHQGAIGDKFLAKKGSLGDGSEKKGVIKCESAQNPGNFNHF